MAEPEQREPSFLKKTRDAVVLSLGQLVLDARELPPVERAQVLNEVARAVAALEDAQTRTRVAWQDAQFRQVGR